MMLFMITTARRRIGSESLISVAPPCGVAKRPAKDALLYRRFNQRVLGFLNM